MIDPLLDELNLVRERYGDATLEARSDGTRRLVLPAVPLAAGWDRAASPVWINVPAGYPNVRPDCFFAAGDLRLSGGGEPTNSAAQQLDGASVRWFSWHPASWDPGRDGLGQYVRFVERRLAEAR